MTKNKRKTRKISYLIFCFALFSFLILLFSQINAQVQERYLLKEYANKIENLTRENQDLEMKLINKNGLDNVETFAQKMDFEKTEKIHYIKVLGTTVVAK